MNKKILILILLLATIGTASAAYWIYSNTVTITVTEYTLELEADQTQISRFNNITFTARLSIDYMLPVQDATINLLKNDQVIMTDTTDSSGYAYFSVNMTDPLGIYDFKAAYQTP